jgi:hypothetical protein
LLFRPSQDHPPIPAVVSHKELAIAANGTAPPKPSKKEVELGNNEKEEKNMQNSLVNYKIQVRKKKAGKCKLFHSLVKLAEELKGVWNESKPLQANVSYANQMWYKGGLWRASTVLPGMK